MLDYALRCCALIGYKTPPQAYNSRLYSSKATTLSTLSFWHASSFLPILYIVACKNYSYPSVDKLQMRIAPLYHIERIQKDGNQENIDCPNLIFSEHLSFQSFKFTQQSRFNIAVHNMVHNSEDPIIINEIIVSHSQNFPFHVNLLLPKIHNTYVEYQHQINVKSLRYSIKTHYDHISKKNGLDCAPKYSYIRNTQILSYLRPIPGL